MPLELQRTCSFKGKHICCLGGLVVLFMIFSGITLSLLTEKMAAKVSMPPVLKVMYGIFTGGIPAFPKMLLV